MKTRAEKSAERKVIFATIISLTWLAAFSTYVIFYAPV